MRRGEWSEERRSGVRRVEWSEERGSGVRRGGVE